MEEVKEKEFHLSPIAQPLAGKKLQKRILKLVKRASKQKAIRRGVKEVVKAIRKGERGICIIAGDISPIDVITHLPILCEENGISYIYVNSKEALGTSSQTKRPTSCVLINSTKIQEEKVKNLFDEVLSEIKTLAPTF